MGLVVSLLDRDRSKQAFDFIQEIAFFSTSERKWIENCLEGFFEGKLVDLYEVIFCSEGPRLRGLVTFRKRSLTRATYEIGLVIVQQNDIVATQTIVKRIVEITRDKGANLVFIDLPNSAVWENVREALREFGFIRAGSIPRLHNPTTDGDYFVKRF